MKKHLYTWLCIMWTYEWIIADPNSIHPIHSTIPKALLNTIELPNLIDNPYALSDTVMLNLEYDEYNRPFLENNQLGSLLLNNQFYNEQDLSQTLGILNRSIRYHAFKSDLLKPRLHMAPHSQFNTLKIQPLETKERQEMTLGITIGSFETIDALATAKLKGTRYAFSSSVTSLSSSGLPSYGPYRTYGEGNRVRNISTTNILKLYITPNWNIAAINQLTSNRIQDDRDFIPPLPNAPLSYTLNQKFVLGGKLQYVSSDRRWRQTVQVTTEDYNSKFQTPTRGDKTLNNLVRSTYKISWMPNKYNEFQTSVHWNKYFFTRQDISSKRTESIYAVLEHTFKATPSLSFGWALTTHKQNPYKNLHGFLLHGEFRSTFGTLSTTFVRSNVFPSLWYIYQSSGSLSNLTLKPTHRDSFKTIYEKDFLDEKILFKFTYFNINSINYMYRKELYKLRWTIRNANLRREGAEIMLKVRPHNTISITGRYILNNYSSQDPLSYSAKNQHKFSLKGTWNMYEDVTLSSTFTYMGKRIGQNFFSPNKTTPITMPAFSLLDMNLEYKWNKQVSLNFSIDNIFDKRYQRIYGFRSPGRSFFFNTRYTF